jgi:ABC-type branched-subunit amino acid transport system ATPase component
VSDYAYAMAEGRTRLDRAAGEVAGMEEVRKAYLVL